MSKKVMSLILFDGTAEGPQKYSIGNKKIVGYKISREFITDEMDSSFYDELHSQGVYVLIGNRNNGKGENIYIGQSDNIAKRLNDHKGGKDGEKECGKTFWYECMAFVSDENSIDIEYLEEQFYNKAYDARRYTLDNINKPGEKEISEASMINSDEFLMDCDLLSKIMGRPIFTSEPEADEDIKIASDCLFIDNSNRYGALDEKLVIAKGHKLENGEFLILEGSIITNEVTKKASNSIKKIRRDLKKSGEIKEIDGKLEFTKECRFESAGIAASIVLGRSASAKEWK